jgi:FixJ family two-component response regulator
MTITSYFPMADALTSREQEITRLVSTGLSNKEIAQHLNISERRRRWTGACGIRSRALPWRIVGRRLCVRSADQQGPCVRCVLH